MFVLQIIVVTQHTIGLQLLLLLLSSSLLLIIAMPHLSKPCCEKASD